MTARSLFMLMVGAAAALLVSCSLLVTQDNCLANTDCDPGFSCNVDVGLCRDLTAAPECTELIGEWEKEDVILLGFIAPLSGDNTESGLFLRRAVELAVEEIQRVGGIGGNQQGRPLAVLLCDDRGDPEVGVRAARHLVEVAHVPAIVGAAFSRVTTRIAEEVTIAAGTLLISPASTAVEISTLDDNALVWRTIAPDSLQADAMAHFATWEVLQGAGVDAQGAASQSTARVQVALAFPDDIYGNGLANSFEEVLRSSLETVLNFGVPDMALGASGLDLTVSSHTYVPGDAGSMSAAAAAVVAQDPDVVLLAGYDESAGLLEEFLVIDGVGSSTSFFLSDGLRSDDLSTALGNTEDIKPRLLFGTNPGGRLDSDTVWLGFRDSYSERWSEPAGELHNYVENAYDATYLLAYALAGSSGDQPTGTEMAAVLGQLQGGGDTTLLIGENHAVQSFNAFASGQQLLLRGASGDISFDAHGDPEAASIIRWDLAFQPGTSTWNIAECGIATTYDVGGGRRRDWCAAYCTDTVPLQNPTPGDDDDSAGDDDDSAGDDDDSVGGEDPCRPAVMG
jgi:branched-chain amino acid transport system substrate-binding protein